MLGSIESPYKSASDSPSRQLLWELGQLQLRDQQNFYEQLDKDAEEREALLRSALETAALEHEKIRKSAEVEREKLELQLQLEKELRRQEELKELERVRREKAERELEAQKQKIEEARAAEAAEREADAKRAAHAAAVEQARAEREKRDAEYARQAAEREEANRKAAEAEAKAREAAIAAAKARDEAAKVPTPAIAPVQKQIVQPARPSSPITTPVRVHGDREAEHRRYLEIHQKLKQLRKFMANCAKQDANLKKVMGDSRRTIRKCVGQLTGEKSNNREPMREIVTLLKSSLAFTQPQVPITDYLFSLPKDQPDPNGPALLLYLLNIVAKSLISQFIGESSVSPQSADAIGVIGSSVFAQTEFRWGPDQQSLIDVFVAKYHVVCPVLFGIYGSESTVQGKQRLGWKRDENGHFVTEQRHSERMTGLGAGFAAMALRNFEKSKLRTPYPTWHFWRALANVTNVPDEAATRTHFIVLKAMLENNEARILEFFGRAGIVALRHAVVDFPKRVKIRDSGEAKAVALLRETMQKDSKLYL